LLTKFCIYALCRDETQRWELIAVALAHCELCVRHGVTSTALALADPRTLAGPSALAPGADVLLDLAREGCVAQAALTALTAGTDKLAEERHAAAYGVAKEAAVLAALSLFRAGLDCLGKGETVQQPGGLAPARYNYVT
jgi:hypothetical protein